MDGVFSGKLTWFLRPHMYKSTGFLIPKFAHIVWGMRGEQNKDKKYVLCKILPPPPKKSKTISVYTNQWEHGPQHRHPQLEPGRHFVLCGSPWVSASLVRPVGEMNPRKSHEGILWGVLVTECKRCDFHLNLLQLLKEETIVLNQQYQPQIMEMCTLVHGAIPGAVPESQLV